MRSARRYIVNIGRGSVIDQNATIALREKRDRGCGPRRFSETRTARSGEPVVGDAECNPDARTCRARGGTTTPTPVGCSPITFASAFSAGQPHCTM